MKLTKALFVLALALTLAVPAFAETQNVKVSGSIDMYAFYRDSYDLNGGNDSGAVPAGTAVGAGGGAAATLTHRSEGDSFFRSNTQVEVAADLTDNVSTVINVVNQRDWNADTFGTSTGAAPNNQGAEFDVVLDLAYAQMKEIFYSPLTLTIGRQDIWLGRGFIIGNNSTVWDTQGSTLADEYSVTTAFDAVRATLDFNPWTVDFIYSKITENGHDPEDDTDLWVANVNYKFAEYNAVAEGYFVSEADRATLSTSTTVGAQDNTTYMLGGRAQFDPISQITLGGELAFQFGDYRSAVALAERDRNAWGLDLFGTYRWDNPWKTGLTLEYVVFSGDEGVSTTDDFGGWNMLYRGQFWTAIADFRETVYATADTTDQPASQNSQFLQLKGTMKPLEDLMLEPALTFLWNEEEIAGRSTEIGWEFDVVVTYDYTEDVSFGLLTGWFVPGDYYSGNQDETATDVVSSVKVTF